MNTIPAIDGHECKACDFEHAKRISRAKWVCPKCGRDFSIEYLLWVEVAHPEWLNEPATHSQAEGMS